MHITDRTLRQCLSCNKIYTLNIFSVNNKVCRYCQKGIKPPHHNVKISSITNNIAPKTSEDPKSG